MLNSHPLHRHGERDLVPEEAHRDFLTALDRAACEAPLGSLGKHLGVFKEGAEFSGDLTVRRLREGEGETAPRNGEVLISTSEDRIRANAWAQRAGHYIILLNYKRKSQCDWWS